MYQVSILVPVYGVEKYIERCARSLFEQTYENLEYIFVNDCTPDKSMEILMRVMEDYPNRKGNVRIFHHEHNRGLSAARNTALDAATSPFVTHVDSDDYLDCDVDYISGGGVDWFTTKRTDGRNIINEMAAKGYNIALDEASLMNAGLPVLALLAPDNLPVAAERGELYRNSVARGLDLLSQASGDKGFCMMLEGSCIDDWLHGNDIGKAMEELLDFDRTIGDVLQWAEKDGHTLVFITADHATGCLTLQDGNLEEGVVGVAFGGESHNGIAVPYYAWGPGADKFGGILENDEIGRRLSSFIK